jgi:hypothetical protein
MTPRSTPPTRQARRRDGVANQGSEERELRGTEAGAWRSVIGDTAASRTSPRAVIGNFPAWRAGVWTDVVPEPPCPPSTSPSPEPGDTWRDAAAGHQGRCVALVISAQRSSAAVGVGVGAAVASTGRGPLAVRAARARRGAGSSRPAARSRTPSWTGAPLEPDLARQLVRVDAVLLQQVGVLSWSTWSGSSRSAWSALS